LVVVLILLVAATPALAHALLLRSVPDANAALDRAPAQVDLYFSEALDSSFSKIIVLDSTGKKVDNGDSKVDNADPTLMTVSLPSLPDGVYTVSWQALSSTDGHVTTGTLPFAVGNVDAAALAAAGQASRQIKVPLGEVVANWLSYLSAAVLVGGTLFVLLVWQPVAQALGAEADSATIAQPPWERLAMGALAVLALAGILGLLVQGGQVSGTELALPWSDAVSGVLFQTRLGVIWLARTVLLLALALLLARAPTRRTRWLAVGVGLLLLLSISLSSHAAAEPDPILPVLGDWVHLLAASAWVGGLTHFTVALWVVRRSQDAKGQPLASRVASRLLPRFSALALLSVATLALTGLYMAILRLGSFDLLFNTLYGQTLIVKILLALPMVGMGAVNLLWTTPAMRRAAGAASDASVVAFFRRFVTSEVSLGVVVLLSVGFLTALPPARTTATAAALRASANVDDLSLSLSIQPGKVGLNTFTLKVTSGGQPVVGAKQVALRFTPTVANLAPSQAVLTDSGNGLYTARGAYLSLPDNWQVQAVVRRDGKFDSFANFSFPLGAAATATAFPWHRLSGGLLLLAAVLLYFALARIPLGQRRVARLGRAGWAPALALCAVGLVVYYQSPPAPNSGPVNPIPPNADSVARGKALYLANCLPCHGPAGKGDGPVGLTLNPRPADLSAHAVPGVHTDGQLYTWITNGFPGSVMPAFKSVLTDDNRWDLVNYVRTLAPK
jgi:copper transport protein